MSEPNEMTREERAVWYAKQMNERVTELKGQIPSLSDDELGFLLEENLVTTRFFKTVYDIVIKEKIDRQVKSEMEKIKLEEEAEEAQESVHVGSEEDTKDDDTE